MRFINSFSTALVTLLLATSAVGELTQIVSPRSASISARAPVKLGPDPGKNAKRKEYFKFCGKAQTKKGSRSVEVEERDLVARAPPAGFDEVAPGANAARTATQNGLWSTGFGTCVGFAVTGTPATAGANTRFLMHMTTSDWPSMTSQWTSFAAKVDAAGLTGMAGIMYTVDTRASNTAELSDPYMKDEAAAEETDYAELWKAFKAMVPGAARAYHPFSRTGTLQINQQNRINYT